MCSSLAADVPVGAAFTRPPLLMAVLHARVRLCTPPPRNEKVYSCRVMAGGVRTYVQLVSKSALRSRSRSGKRGTSSGSRAAVSDSIDMILFDALSARYTFCRGCSRTCTAEVCDNTVPCAYVWAGPYMRVSLAAATQPRSMNATGGDVCTSIRTRPSPRLRKRSAKSCSHTRFCVLLQRYVQCAQVLLEL